MRADRSELDKVSATERELRKSELDDVVGGSSAKTFQANGSRFDPYKTFKFRLS